MIYHKFQYNFRHILSQGFSTEVTREIVTQKNKYRRYSNYYAGGPRDLKLCQGFLQRKRIEKGCDLNKHSNTRA